MALDRLPACMPIVGRRMSVSHVWRMPYTRDYDHNSTVLAKRDRRESFANPWDGTGTIYVFTGSCGNAMGMEPMERDRMELVFVSIPTSLSSVYICLYRSSTTNPELSLTLVCKKYNKPNQISRLVT